MYNEWVLIFLLSITVCLVYVVILLRSLLSRLETLPTATAQAQQPMAVAPPVVAPLAAGGQAEMDEEITAVVVAAIAAYEEGK